MNADYYATPTLIGEHVRLEALRADHAAGLLKASDDDGVFRWLAVDRPTTLADAEALVAEYLARTDLIMWVQVDLDTGDVAGVTTYYDIVPALRTVAIGHTWIGSRFWRTALNTEAKLLLLRRAFDDLDCVRVVWHTDIRNTRQFAIVSQEELDRTAADMGLDRLDPALLGSTMVIAGIPDFSHLPPSSRLQGEGGATLVVDMNNRPCTLPARPIENRHQGFGAKFKPAAMNRRGITAWVEREGTFHLGEKIRLHVPDQRSWDFLAEARG